MSPAGTEERAGERLDLARTLWGVVARLECDGLARIIEHPSAGAIHLSPGHGSFTLNHGDIRSLSGLADAEYRVRTTAGPWPPEGANGEARPREELLWNIGHAVAGGRLAEGLSPTGVFRLVAWPNVTRLPVGEHGLRITALLARAPTSIPVAGRLTGAPRSELFEYLTAAHAAGFLEVVNQSVPGRERELETREAGRQRSPSIVSALLAYLRGAGS